MTRQRPALAVLSTLFPSDAQPVAGVFVRERMFRVAHHLPVTVISPQPWFPGQALLRAWKPDYRPPRAAFEVMDGVEVHRPRFFALPGVLRHLDGWFVALASRPILRRLQQEGRADILDVHFGYPDGYAGRVLARWCRLPFVLTLRGKEERLSAQPPLRRRMSAAVREADKVISVSSALRDVALGLGAPADKAVVVGNGVDLSKFFPVPREQARAALGLDADAPVLVSVGTLVERKGFHRVIACLPSLLARYPKLVLLVVGGAGAEGDWSAQIRQSAVDAGVVDHVRFLGAMKPEELRVPLSAADVFVLATRYEGWANVFLEAMACGLPVVTTRVGGNAEVVADESLGTLVPFGDAQALTDALDAALQQPWDRAAIVRHAQANTWDQRIHTLVGLFSALGTQPGPDTQGISTRGHRP